MQKQRNRLIELNQKKKQAKEYLESCEEEYKSLQEELIGDAEDKFTEEGFNFTKVPRYSYKLKEGISEEDILAKYPSVAKVDTNALFKIADNPDELLETNHTEYFLIKESKEKKEKSKEF